MMRSSKPKTAKTATQRTDLLKLIGDNNITRRRARALYGQVAEQIEEAKQAIDPDEIVTTAPEPEPIPRLGKSWAQRAGLGPRGRDRYITTDVGPKEAQDAMEWMSMMVLEHANFDSE
jgi:epoxyqueuosine reductase QueG